MGGWSPLHSSPHIRVSFSVTKFVSGKNSKQHDNQCTRGLPVQAQPDDDRAVYCSFQKQTSYTFRGYVLLGERDVTKFQGCTLLAV